MPLTVSLQAPDRSGHVCIMANGCGDVSAAVKSTVSEAQHSSSSEAHHSSRNEEAGSGRP